MLQAGHQAGTTAADSDSEEDLDQYSDLDAFDTDEVEVSPDDEQALAAFMVSMTCKTPCSLAKPDSRVHPMSCLPSTSSIKPV